MQAISAELVWALVLGIAVFFALVIVIIAIATLSQRQLIKAQLEKLSVLEESEERFRALMEKSSDAIMLVDKGGIILYASLSNEGTLGFKPEELVGKKIFQFLQTPDLATAYTLFSDLIRTPNNTISGEFQARVRDGSWRWLEGVANNLLESKSVHAVVVNYRDITDRKKADDKLKMSHEQLRALAARLQSAREEERTYVAREIHDEFGLVAAIQWQAREFQQRTRIKTVVETPQDSMNLDEKQSTALFRIYQEALANVARHAKASQVNVNLQSNGEYYILSIEDNGKGITHNEMNALNSLGIVGMKERAIIFGGEVNISGEQNRGTVVSVRIPKTLSK